MAGESKLHCITPEALPELLSRLDNRTIDLALIGPIVSFSASPDEWLGELQGRDVY